MIIGNSIIQLLEMLFLYHKLGDIAGGSKLAIVHIIWPSLGYLQMPVEEVDIEKMAFWVRSAL